MELNKDILISLIKEEIDKKLNEESMQDAIETMQNSLSRMMGAMGYTDPDQLDTIYQQAKQDLEPGAANRKDIQEMGCGDMQAIDMGVDNTHDHEDHEGSMAKRQMFKTAEYATIIFDMLDDGEELPAWIQSKLTKVADYIGVVKHYLEYDKVMDMQPANRKEKKWSDADHDKQEDIAQKLAKDNPDMPKDEKMAIAGAQVNREKRKRNK